MRKTCPTLCVTADIPGYIATYFRFLLSGVRPKAERGTHDTLAGGDQPPGGGVECCGVCPGKPEIAVLFVPIDKPWDSGP